MQEQIFEALVEKGNDEITWQSILQDLMKKEGMDPWDINVSALSKMYIKRLKELKEHDFRISGKVVLAAAILLKLKSTKFIDEDIMELDRIINSSQNDMSEEDFYEEIAQDFHTPGNITDEEKHKLIPRTPQPRKRKVSIYDLMSALDQALEVRRRRVINSMPDEERLIPPAKGIDISVTIKSVYSKIYKHYNVKTSKLTFNQLVPAEDRQAKIYTFLPMLYLTNLRKIDIKQEGHLDDIDIHLLRKANKIEIEKELELKPAE